MAEVTEIGYLKPGESIPYTVGKSEYGKVMSDQPIYGNGQLLHIGIYGRVGLNLSGAKVVLGHSEGRLISSTVGRKNVKYDSGESKTFYDGELGLKSTATDNYMLAYGKMLQPFALVPNMYHKVNADSNSLHEISVKLGMGSVNPNTPTTVPTV